jgi:hypothetical protein
VTTIYEPQDGTISPKVNVKNGIKLR